MPLMNVNEHELIETVVGAAYEVSNSLGCGFLEKVYERALIRELTLRGLSTRAQRSYEVIYKNERVGEYFADIISRRPIGDRTQVRGGILKPTLGSMFKLP
jgi:hypothetical protein